MIIRKKLQDLLNQKEQLQQDEARLRKEREDTQNQKKQIVEQGEKIKEEIKTNDEKKKKNYFLKRKQLNKKIK